MKPRLILLSAACALALSLRGAEATLSTLTYSGEQTALETLDRELNAAGNDAAKLAAVEKQLVDVLRKADSTFAARQAAATRLGLVLRLTGGKAGADTLKLLGNLLTTEREADLARLALDRVPGDAIDQLLVGTLPKTAGRARLGLLDTLARRRVATAVRAIAPLARDEDAPTATAAIRALGEIATPEALAALGEAPAAHRGAIVSAQLAAAPRLEKSTAAALLDTLQREASDPAQRAAALRLQLGLDPAAAPARIAEVLAGSDWTPKQAAFEAVQTLPAAAFVAAVAPKLASYDAPTQVAVLSAFGRQGEATAIPALVAAAAHTRPDIRQAAIDALGRVPGTPDTALLLAKIGADSGSDDARLARQSLARLSGPNVAPAILSGAERGDPAVRPVFVEQLALRNMTEALPLLLKLRTDADAAVRTAAVGALGEIGTAAEQAAVVAWAAQASDSAEQAKALAALVKLTLRLPDAATRGRAFFAAIESAPAEVAVRLVPALARLGDQAAAETAARLAARNDPAVAEAAVNALGRWSDRTALAPLATVAGSAPLENVRASAGQAALRQLERNRDKWTAETTEVVARLTAATKDAAARKRLLALLNRANNEAAVPLAESFAAEPALAEAARETADVIRANLKGTPRLRASGGAGGLKNLFDGKTDTRWSVPAEGEEWLEIDFHVSRPVHQLTLDQSGRGTEFPEKYEVYVTDDPAAPGALRASGAGQRNKTVIDLPKGTRGRYVIIKNTAERKDTPWTICELFVE
jgi:HEAT repeat protein